RGHRDRHEQQFDMGSVRCRRNSPTREVAVLMDSVASVDLWTARLIPQHSRWCLGDAEGAHLLMRLDDEGARARFVIRERDSTFTYGFHEVSGPKASA